MYQRIFSIGLLLTTFCRAASAQVGWYELGAGLSSWNADYSLMSVTTSAAGNVYVAGPLNSSANSYVAWWNGVQWAELGAGVNSLNTNDVVRVLATDASGDVYAAGDFVNSNGKPRVARWNGSAWADLDPNGLNAAFGESIMALHANTPADVYAAGDLRNSVGKYYVAHWNGTAWAELGAGAGALNADSPVMALAADVAGNLYAAGYFAHSAGKYVAKWDGTAWTALGAGTLGANAEILALACDAAGNVYAAGNFTNSALQPYVAKWNGTVWAELGALNANGTIEQLAVDATGKVYAAGNFTNTAGQHYVARWNGGVWEELGVGTGALEANGRIRAMQVTPLGKVYAGGDFTYADRTFVAVYDGKKGPAVDSIDVRTIGSVPAQIAATGGVLDVEAIVYPLSINGDVTWSIVPGTGNASISATAAGARVTGLSNGTVWAKAVSLFDVAKKDSLLITIGDIPAGIDDLHMTMGLTLYPNPVKDVIHISARENHPELSLVLTDGLGRLISSRKLQPNALKQGLSLNLESLASGVYYLGLSGTGVSYTHKITRN